MESTGESAGARLRSLREAAGLRAENLADEIGISAVWFEELENDEAALEESLDLEQIRKLSLLLGAGLPVLVTGAPLPPEVTPLSFKDLARHLRRRLENEPGLETLEEKSGWDLGTFVKRPEPEGWGQRLPFFRDVCGVLGLDWRGILAYCDSVVE